jgi:two-component system sensor histidine kinase/response regulator
MVSKKSFIDNLNKKTGPLPDTKDIRVLLCILSLAIYMLCFELISHSLGRGMAMLAIIPVMTVGGLYGMRPGVCAAVLTLPISLLLYSLHETNPVSTTSLVFGTLGLVLAGSVIGRMRDISQLLRREVIERHRVEKELNEYQEGLANTILHKTEELKATNEQLEYLIEASLDPIVITDKENIVARANNAFLELLGYSSQEVFGQPMNSYFITSLGSYESNLGEVINISQKDMDEIINEIAELLEKGRYHNFPSYLINKEGKAVLLTSNIVLFYDKNNEQSGSFGILHDMTEQRKNEIELIKAKEAAEEANLAKSAFLANMSHEIRTPMNGVIGFTDLLLNSELNNEQIDFAQTIKRSGEALLSLINDILDFSKIEAGKTSLEDIEFDIEMLAYDVCEIIKPRVSSKNIEMLCKIDDNLPAQVKGDPHRFRQVLINLLGNAVKFTKKGEIELSLHVEKELEDRILIITKVRDTGIGIPADKAKNIFDVFQQVDGSTTRKYGGSGLGLSICKKIAAFMDGDITVESKPDIGSTFIFSAWLYKSENKKLKRLPPVSLSGKKVLISDDNQANLDILNHVLTSAGIIVTACSSGEETIKTIVESSEKNDPFDMCILDIMMPGMNGHVLAKMLRKKYSVSTPLLAFSSSIDDSAASCAKSGFNGFLPKPINKAKLFRIMEGMLFEAREQKKHKLPETRFITQHSMKENAKLSTSILVAEDNPVNQKLILKLLTKAGYPVSIAKDGKEAVNMFESEPDKYDIIIMDIQMPELNGFDSTKLLREKGFEDIPIIAMTANALKGDREKCLEAGMNDYMSKPIKREVVFEKLRKWVIEKP